MEDMNIRNFINSSSLGVYTKYIKVIDGHKYLVKFIIKLLNERILEVKKCLFQNQN